MIQRLLLKQILEDLYKGKVLLVIGPRQSGKTTLVNQVVGKSGKECLFLSGDDADVREKFRDATSTGLKALTGNFALVVIDEAQRIADIGIVLKLFIDHIKKVQVIATGSSSLDLANKINEPLTGRKHEHFVFPISYQEMIEHHGQLEESRLMEHRLVYGYYPEVVTNPGDERRILASVSDSYLYKDLFAYEKMKKPSLLQNLIKALALQLGSEVSYNELAQIIGADKETVERYIDLLEKTFVVFRLNAFNRNLRRELKKSKKIYFYDNGIRNAIIGNFSPIGLRTDKGALWENFLISERMKMLHYRRFYGHRYFWRTVQQQEIDYLEEVDGKLYAFEFKWNNKGNVKIPRTFIEAYPGSEFQVITRSNYESFLTM